VMREEISEEESTPRVTIVRDEPIVMNKQPQSSSGGDGNRRDEGKRIY